MKNFKEHLPITFSTLYVGLYNDWLTTKEVAVLIGLNRNKFQCNENSIVEVFVNDDEKEKLLEILQKNIQRDDDTGIRGWYLAQLSAIESSELTVHDKLKEIEIQWSRFDYPESWRNFIYYLPNNVNSEDELYKIFLSYLDSLRTIK